MRNTLMDKKFLKISFKIQIKYYLKTLFYIRCFKSQQIYYLPNIIENINFNTKIKNLIFIIHTSIEFT